MIRPIGFEPEGKSRLPWATLALSVALVAGFVAARGELLFTGGAGEIKLENALDVWLSNPYLTPDPLLLAQIEDGPDGHKYSARIAEARESAAAASAVTPAKRAQEQAELDYATSLALRGTDVEPGPTHPFRKLGFVASAARVGAVFAHPFLHAGFLHLALVLVLLWLAAPALEAAYGGAAFGALCLVCALAAAGAYWLAAFTAAPLVGAWPVAAGLVAAFIVRFGDEEVRLGRAESLVAPAWFVLPVWLIASAVSYLFLSTAAVETGESFAPNLAGFTAGALGALGIQALRVEERRAIRAREAREQVTQVDPRLRKARDAATRGSHDQAISLATAVLRERPDDADALLAVWNSYLASGREAHGIGTAKRLIEVYARHGQLALAARVWDDLVRALPESRLETTVLLRIVPELVVQARRDAAIAALRCVTSHENGSLSVGQAVRAAELALELDPRCALLAARSALSRAGELADDRREKLTKLAAELEGKLGGAAVRDLPPAPRATAETLTESRASPVTPVRETPAASAELESADLESASQAETIPTMVFTPRVAPDEPPFVPPTIPSAPPLRERVEPSTVKVTAAVPVELDPAGVRMRIDGAAPSLLAWEHIQAVGVGLVAGIAPKPIVIIDLATNWADCGDGVLEVLRMRSDSFRARALVGGEGSALEALRALLAQLLARSGGVPLPDGGSAHGLPFREFPDPSSYERDVLLHAG